MLSSSASYGRIDIFRKPLFSSTVRVPACVRCRKWKQLVDMQPRFILTIQVLNLSEQTPTEWPPPHPTIPTQRFVLAAWNFLFSVINGNLSFDGITYHQRLFYPAQELMTRFVRPFQPSSRYVCMPMIYTLNIILLLYSRVCEGGRD
jgi:hypothetical protein